jgi:hypothetical protein
MTTLIVILVLYLLIRFSSRYLLPYILKRYINIVKKNLESQQQQYQNSNTTQGKSKIDIKSSPQEKHNDVDSIEYTDFEEVKDDQKQ